MGSNAVIGELMAGGGAVLLPSDRFDADELWREGLERFGGPFLAGRAFGALDAFFAPIAFRLQTYGLTLSPPAQAYAERLLALPSMQAWQTAALAETWREPGHEAEARAAGEWLRDLRASGDDHG